MSRSFDLDGSGQPDPASPDFNSGTGLGSDTAAIGDAYGSTGFRDGPADPRGGDFIFDPDIHIARNKLNQDGSFKKKRRRRGLNGAAHASRPKADIQASIEGLSKTLMVIHIGIAEMTKTPEFVLQTSESDALASSIANVLGEFDITPDPKVQAVIGLMMTAGMIYGPRMYNIRERVKRSENKPKGTVHTLRPVDNNSQMHVPEEVMQ